MNFTASDTLKGQIFGSVEGELKFAVNGSTEAMRIDSSGKLLVGDSASHTSDLLQIETPASGGGHGIQIRRNDANGDQNIGTITFGNNTDTDLAQIKAKTDGDSNAGDSGALLFSTQVTSGSLTERMRITSDGKVGIGNTNPQYKLDVDGTAQFSPGSSAALFQEYSNGMTLWLDGSDGDFVGGDYFGIHAYGTTSLDFSYGAATKFSLANNGDASFEGSVTVKDGTTEFGISGDSSGNTYLASNGEIRVRPSGTTVNKLVIGSNGNITTVGTISAGNITTSGYLAGPATFTIDPAAVGDNTGTVVIAGNLQVDGTTTTINSTTLTVDDKNITLARALQMLPQQTVRVLQLIVDPVLMRPLLITALLILGSLIRELM